MPYYNDYLNTIQNSFQQGIITPSGILKELVAQYKKDGGINSHHTFLAEEFLKKFCDLKMIGNLLQGKMKVSFFSNAEERKDTFSIKPLEIKTAPLIKKDNDETTLNMIYFINQKLEKIKLNKKGKFAALINTFIFFFPKYKNFFSLNILENLPEKINISNLFKKYIDLNDFCYWKIDPPYVTQFLTVQECKSFGIKENKKMNKEVMGFRTKTFFSKLESLQFDYSFFEEVNFIELIEKDQYIKIVEAIMLCGYVNNYRPRYENIEFFKIWLSKIIPLLDKDKLKSIKEKSYSYLYDFKCSQDSMYVELFVHILFMIALREENINDSHQIFLMKYKKSSSQVWRENIEIFLFEWLKKTAKYLNSTFIKEAVTFFIAYLQKEKRNNEDKKLKFAFEFILSLKITDLDYASASSLKNGLEKWIQCWALHQDSSISNLQLAAEAYSHLMSSGSYGFKIENDFKNDLLLNSYLILPASILLSFLSEKEVNQLMFNVRNRAELYVQKIIRDKILLEGAWRGVNIMLDKIHEDQKEKIAEYVDQKNLWTQLLKYSAEQKDFNLVGKLLPFSKNLWSILLAPLDNYLYMMNKGFFGYAKVHAMSFFASMDGLIPFLNEKQNIEFLYACKKVLKSMDITHQWDFLPKEVLQETSDCLTNLGMKIGPKHDHYMYIIYGLLLPAIGCRIKLYKKYEENFPNNFAQICPYDPECKSAVYACLALWNQVNLDQKLNEGLTRHTNLNPDTAAIIVDYSREYRR